MTSPADHAAAISEPWPTEHHHRCDSHVPDACDCYMRRYEVRRAALAALVAQAEAAREALLRQAEREEQNESQAKSEDDHRSAVIHGYCALKLRMLLAGGDSR